jgi:hypothetical protein
MTDFNFDSLFDDVESATRKLVGEINCIKHEVELIETDYDELLKSLGATDLNSALEAVRELKAAINNKFFATPVIKLSDSTALTHAELTAILTQSISKAVDELTATAPTVKKARTFRDSAGVN